MIHVNVRGLIIRKSDEKTQLLIQLRKRQGEPEVYELPGGRLNEYESMPDGLRREIREETGLQVAIVQNEEKRVFTKGNGSKSSFSTECIKPYAAYQTIEGPVDSFGVYFMCEAEGELLSQGDDTADIHWADAEELQRLIAAHKFSEIDLPVVLMFLRDVE